MLLDEGPLTSLAFKLFERMWFFAPGPLMPHVLPTCQAVISSLPYGTIRTGSIKLFGPDLSWCKATSGTEGYAGSCWLRI